MSSKITAAIERAHPSKLWSHPMRLRPTLVGGAALVAVAALALSPDLANAAKMITGADIEDGTITSADIANHSLLAKDFKKGELPVDPQLYTWTYSHTAGTTPGQLDVDSAQTIPPGTAVVGVGLDVSSLSSAGCVGGVAVTVGTSEPIAQTNINAPNDYSQDTYRLEGSGLLGPKHLHLNVDCFDSVTGNETVVPTFTMTVTFTETAEPTASPSPFS